MGTFNVTSVLVFLATMTGIAIWATIKGPHDTPNDQEWNNHPADIKRRAKEARK